MSPPKNDNSITFSNSHSLKRKLDFLDFFGVSQKMFLPIGGYPKILKKGTFLVKNQPFQGPPKSDSILPGKVTTFVLALDLSILARFWIGGTLFDWLLTHFQGPKSEETQVKRKKMMASKRVLLVGPKSLSAPPQIFFYRKQKLWENLCRFGYWS